MKYGYSKQTELPFMEAVEKTKGALLEAGFGVLTTIDVKATMKEKLGEDYDNYLILGACSPSFAHKALQVEKEIGLLLPCNVIVYEDKGKVNVSAIMPSVAMNMVENEELGKISVEVEEKLKKVVDSI